jgi:hypothetical protein
MIERASGKLLGTDTRLCAAFTAGLVLWDVPPGGE